MTLALSLPEPTVEVVPGRSSPLVAVVRNDGGEAQRVRLEVSGRAAAWVQVGAAGPSTDWQVVEPGHAVDVTLLVTPPRGAAVPGQLVPFTVRLSAPGASRPTGVATGLVLVCAPVPVSAVLVPQDPHAAGPGSYLVELTTDDPGGVLVTLRGTSSGTGATVAVDPVAVRVPPGSVARADVRVRPGRPAVWRTRQHPFEVVWETEAADGLARGSLRGRLDSPPVLPRPVTALLLLGLVTVLGLGVVLLSPLGGRDGGSADGGQGSTASTQPNAGPPGDGPLAVVGTELLTADASASLRRAQQRAAALQHPPGTATDVLDASAVPGWEAGFWLLVVHGFADADAARAFCDGPDGPPGCRVVERA